MKSFGSACYSCIQPEDETLPLDICKLETEIAKKPIFPKPGRLTFVKFGLARLHLQLTFVTLRCIVRCSIPTFLNGARGGACV
jgi:hypothetical protein